MSAGKGAARLAVFLMGVSLLCGCTAPRQSVKPQAQGEPKEKAVTVRLPALTPLKIEPPSTSPQLDQEVTPSDVQDGIARSTKLFEFNYTSGKVGPPVGQGLGPPDDVVPDVETP